MNRIKAIRLEKEMTQKALAQAAGVSAPFLHDLENGNRSAKPSTMRRIANALGCPVDQLRGGETDAKAAVS